jgi:hypothetical protein
VNGPVQFLGELPHRPVTSDRLEINDMNDNNTPDPVQPQDTPLWVALFALIVPILVIFAAGVMLT